MRGKKKELIKDSEYPAKHFGDRLEMTSRFKVDNR